MGFLSDIFDEIFGSSVSSSSEDSESSKHSPFTSEYSKPHTSKDCPELHVDNLHFGEGGKHDSRLDVDHITDPGAIERGQEIYDWHQGNK